jgi:hypothetical protein
MAECTITAMCTMASPIVLHRGAVAGAALGAGAAAAGVVYAPRCGYHPTHPATRNILGGSVRRQGGTPKENSGLELHHLRQHESLLLPVVHPTKMGGQETLKSALSLCTHAGRGRVFF